MKPTSENVGFWLVYTIIRIYSTRVWFIYAVSGNLFLNFIFSKENDSNFAFKKYIPPLLRSMWRNLRFLLWNSFWRIFLQRKNLGNLMRFMTLKNVWGKALAKNSQKKFFMDFLCFSNLSARFCAFFFAVFFCGFFFILF